MDDKRMPMEAEVQELPPRREPAAPDDFYGTSAKPRPRRNHTGALICLSLILIAASTVSILYSIFHFRLVMTDGVLKILTQAPPETEATEDTVKKLEGAENGDYVPTPSRAVGSVDLRVAQADGDALSPSTIYAQVSPAVVCVEVQSYYGSETDTGVVISEDGYILTANDGLTNAISISVSFANGDCYAAKWMGEERTSGLCLLKIEGEGLPTVAFAQDGEATVGQSVYSVCNPYGSQLPNVFCDGMLAACGKVDAGGRTYRILQMSGQSSTLGSGCPILDSRGLMIGMTTPIGKRLVSGQDPCFAIFADDLTQIVEDFERNASDAPCWLGLVLEDIPEDYQSFFDLRGSVWIAEVAVGTKGYGYLLQYDVITEVDEVEISSVSDYEQVLATHQPGDLVLLKIYRSGDYYKIELPVLAR